MIWLIYFLICISIALFSVFSSFLLSKKPKWSTKVINSFNILFFGVFLMVLFSLIPVFIEVNEQENPNVLSVFLISLHNTFQVFTINSDLNSLLIASKCPSYYSIMLSAEFVVAPLFTAGFLISLLKDFSSYLRLVRYLFRDFYIFSELNDHSVALGLDIKSKNSKAVIVYTGISDNNSKDIDILFDSVKLIHAICFKKDINAIVFSAVRKQILFFAISDDETKNIKVSLEIVNRYKERDNTRLYVFAKGIESEMIFGNLNSGKIIVRRVNDVQSLVHRFLYDEGKRLFESAIQDVNGEKYISVMIIGLGVRGKEFLKALSWYCQMDGYHLNIDAYDIKNNAKSLFEAEAPELMSSDNNGVYVPGEAEYTISIHSGIDVFSKEFADIVKTKHKTTFVFISLGSDERDIKAATYLRMLYERLHIHPIIYSVVNDTSIKQTVSGTKNFSEQPYDINFIGDLESSYSSDVIINSSLEKACVDSYIDRKDKVEAEEKFWKYDYHYRSKVASIIHVKARKECNIPGSSKAKNELNDEEKKIIGDLEHRRWNAYMRADGFVYSGSTDSDTRNNLGKMHNNLVPTAKLSGSEIPKDYRV